MMMGLLGLILLPFFFLILFAIFYPILRTKGKPLSGTMIPAVSCEVIRERVNRENPPYRVSSDIGRWYYRWESETIFEMDFLPGNSRGMRGLYLRVEYRDGVIHYMHYGMVHMGQSKVAEMNRLEGKLRELMKE